MRFVTISDHNTLEGALRIAHLPDTFLSVEVTTRFPETTFRCTCSSGTSRRRITATCSPYRPSVYELAGVPRRVAAFPMPSRIRSTAWGRRSPPAHVERLLLLFSVWEGRNGSRPAAHNEVASRIVKLARPRVISRRSRCASTTSSRATSRVLLCGGSDDHGALDIATTWTEATGETVDEFLAQVTSGGGRPYGRTRVVREARARDGRVVRRTHIARAARSARSPVVAAIAGRARAATSSKPKKGHRQLTSALRTAAEASSARRAQSPAGHELDSLERGRLACLRTSLLAGALQAPFLASTHHHASAPAGTCTRSRGVMLGTARRARDSPPCTSSSPTRTREMNGVAGTMLQAGGRSARREHRRSSRRAIPILRAQVGVTAFEPEWSFPLPTSEHIDLRFPSLLERAPLRRDRCAGSHPPRDARAGRCVRARRGGRCWGSRSSARTTPSSASTPCNSRATSWSRRR